MINQRLHLNYFFYSFQFVLMTKGPHLSLHPLSLNTTFYLEDCYGNRLPVATGYHYIPACASAGMRRASGRGTKKNGNPGEQRRVRSARLSPQRQTKQALRGFFCPGVRRPAVCTRTSVRCCLLFRSENTESSDPPE